MPTFRSLVCGKKALKVTGLVALIIVDVLLSVSEENNQLDELDIAGG